MGNTPEIEVIIYKTGTVDKKKGLKKMLQDASVNETSLI